MSEVEIQNDAQETFAAEDETETVPQDLRAELKINLELKFKANLTDAGILPDAVQKSLVALLGVSVPTSTDILAALSLEDPASPEVPSE